MQREGFEPSTLAWHASVLPLLLPKHRLAGREGVEPSRSRFRVYWLYHFAYLPTLVAEGRGFEPLRALTPIKLFKSHKYTNTALRGFPMFRPVGFRRWPGLLIRCPYLYPFRV